MTDDITRRIADVLRQYRWAISDERGPQRVAEEIVKELGLAQEWTVRSGLNIHNPMAMNKERALVAAQRFPDSFEAVSRLVSSWVRADTEEEKRDD